MLRVLQWLVFMPALLFIVTGVRWLVDPASAAEGFGLDLNVGVGLSSQIGGMASFFLTLGASILFALISQHRVAYYAPILLLLLAALGRLVAWSSHDAALVVDFIAVEIAVAVLLVIASRWLAKEP